MEKSFPFLFRNTLRNSFTWIVLNIYYLEFPFDYLQYIYVDLTHTFHNIYFIKSLPWKGASSTSHYLLYFIHSLNIHSFIAY